MKNKFKRRDIDFGNGLGKISIVNKGFGISRTCLDSRLVKGRSCVNLGYHSEDRIIFFKFLKSIKAPHENWQGKTTTQPRFFPIRPRKRGGAVVHARSFFNEFQLNLDHLKGTYTPQQVEVGERKMLAIDLSQKQSSPNGEQ